MDAIQELLSRGVDQLLGRASGPLHFRLFVMPIVVTILAIRAGLRDAREGRAGFLWGILRKPPAERRQLLRSAVKDIGRIFIVAVLLDTTYQILVLKAFYVGQVVIVAVACAIVPYLLIRGPVALLARLFRPKPSGLAGLPAAAAQGRK